MMIVIRVWTVLAISLAVLPAVFGQSNSDRPIKPVTVCEVLGDLQTYNGKDLAIIGRFDCLSNLLDRTCFLAQDQCQRPITTAGHVWPTKLFIIEDWHDGVPQPPSANPQIDEPSLIETLMILRKTTNLSLHQKTIFKTAKGEWGLAYGKVFSSLELEPKPSCVEVGRRGFRGAPAAFIVNRDTLRSFKDSAYPRTPPHK